MATIVGPPVQSASAQPRERPAAADNFDHLMYLASSGPVFVRLEVMVDGVRWPGASLQRIAETIWTALDRDESGTASPEELGQIDRVLLDLVPEPDAFLGGQLVPFVESIKKNASQTLSREQFTENLVNVSRLRASLAGRIRAGARAVELFDLVDTNQDGSVAAEELNGMHDRLVKLDQDGDDSYSVVEVEPFRNPFAAGVAQVSARSPDTWSLIVPDPQPGENAAAITRLLTHYDGQHGGMSNHQLEPVEMGLAPDAIAKSDANQDGSLDESELANWILQPPLTYQLRVELRQQTRGINRWTWQSQEAAPITKSIFGAVPFGPRDIELRATASRAAQVDLRQFLRLEFRKADGDKNQYLSAEEFAGLGQLRASFKAVDRDGDGMLFEKELLEFLDRQKRMQIPEIVITIDRDEKSLFSLLDLNKDRRLSPRELLNPAAILPELDLDKDGRLSRDELQGRQRITVGVQPPPGFSIGVDAMARMGSGDPVIQTPTEGPDWFRAQDRNQDGEVSPREFVAPIELFSQVDKNGDGLITAEEASAFDKASMTSAP